MACLRGEHWPARSFLRGLHVLPRIDVAPLHRFSCSSHSPSSLASRVVPPPSFFSLPAFPVALRRRALHLHACIGTTNERTVDRRWPPPTTSAASWLVVAAARVYFTHAFTRYSRDTSLGKPDGDREGEVRWGYDKARRSAEVEELWTKSGATLRRNATIIFRVTR